MISVLVNPKPGFNDEDIERILKSFGAKEIEVLSLGFISAKIPKENMKVIEFAVYVQEKQQHK